MVKHRNTYIWRMDIEKFFDHVDHATLKSLLKGRNSYEGLCSEIIDSYKAKDCFSLTSPDCQGGGGQCLMGNSGVSRLAT
jgi:hypothetical protein